MGLDEPFPDLDELLAVAGDAGERLADLQASEGAAGNISMFIGWSLEVRRSFGLVEPIDLPYPAPALAGRQVIVTGSGRRLRDIRRDPLANLAVVAVEAGGLTGRLYTSPRRLFTRVTSEFNSHLAVHNDQVSRTATNFHALIHAQPPQLTYLSHIATYRDTLTLNRRLLRWQPETIVQLPEGIGAVPFLMPGSEALMASTVEALQIHRLVLWSKHGVMARSDVSVTRAADRIEYAETAARYEYMNLCAGERGEGLAPEEIRAVAAQFGAEQTIF